MDIGFILTKLIPLFLYPLGLVSVATIVGLVLLLFMKPRGSAVFLTLAIVITYLTSTPLLVNKIGWGVEGQFLPELPLDYPVADVIVVLGGGVSVRRPPEHAPALNARSDRFTEAARLFHAGRAKWVLLTGGSGLELEISGKISNDGVQLLEELGIPAESIVADGRSRNTFENAIETAELMHARNFETALLVTSAVHMPRAVATFESAGINVIPAPTDYRFSSVVLKTPLFWLPRVEVMSKATAIFREVIGFATYRWNGAISSPFSYFVWQAKRYFHDDAQKVSREI